MVDGHILNCSRSIFVFMTLSFVIIRFIGGIDQGIDRWMWHEDQIMILCQDWHSKCQFQQIYLEVKDVTLKCCFNLRGYSREMSNAAVPYYNNSTAKFRLVIKLIHDVETNSGPDSYSVNQQKNSTYLKIAHLNARSLKNRHHYLLIKKTILSNKFDIFTVFGTWLNSKITNLEIPGYNIYHVDRENKTGGGVCIYVRQAYKTICLQDIYSISVSGFHQLWLKVQVRYLKPIIISTVYRPPDTPKSCLDSDFAANFVYASSLNAPICILGDLNCNLLKPEAPDCKVLGSFCSSYNLTQLIEEPTQVTEQTSSLLDIILVSDIKQVRESFVMHSSVSDHDLVCFTLRLEKPRPKPVYINIRSFKHYNREAFHNDLSQAPWSVIDIFTDIDDKVNAFNTMFNDTLDQHAPIKTIKVKGIPKKSSSKRTCSQDEKIAAENFNNFFVKMNDLANDFGFECNCDRFAPRQYPLSRQFSFKKVEPAVVKYNILNA